MIAIRVPSDDILTITDLILRPRIGVPAQERKKGQRILVTIEMTLNARKAAERDDVKQSINYADVTQDVRTLAATERKTIERFAEDIAAMVLKKYKPKTVTITVKKFPPIGAREVAITILRAGR